MKEIENFLKNFLGTEIKIEKLFSQGEVSEIYLVSSNKKKYILKINCTEYYQNFLKEEWCLEECKKNKIPVPEVFNVIQNEKLCMILLSLVQGKNCSEIQSEGEKYKIYLELGKLSKEVSNIKNISNIGDLKSEEDAKKWFEEDYLGYEINQTKDEDDYLQLTLEQRKKVLECLYLLKKTNFEFVLCHGDLSLNNCIYNDETKTITLIDFGSAETQPKYYFEIMLKWLELNYDKTISEKNYLSFAKGLIGDNYMKWIDGNNEIIKAFALVYVLDKYRWAHDRSTKEWQEKYLSRLTEILFLFSKN